MIKTCCFCGKTEFFEKNVEYFFRKLEQFLIVKNVPCEECAWCGEQYFEAGVLERIEKDFDSIYVSGRKPRKAVSVPVEEFIEIP
jgi:YgiT-type zinc finger domain-containing protein